MIEWTWDDVAELAAKQYRDRHAEGLPAMEVLEGGDHVEVTLLTWQPLSTPDDKGTPSWEPAALPDPVATAREPSWDQATRAACARFRAFYGGTAMGGRWASRMIAAVDADTTPIPGPPPVHPWRDVQAGDLAPQPREASLDPVDRAVVAMGALAAATAKLRTHVQTASDQARLWAGPSTELDNIVRHLVNLEGYLNATQGDPFAAVLEAVHARGICDATGPRRSLSGATPWIALHTCLESLATLLGDPRTRNGRPPDKPRLVDLHRAIEDFEHAIRAATATPQ